MGNLLNDFVKQQKHNMIRVIYFFVIMLVIFISLSIYVKGTDFIQDTGVTYTKTQTVNALEGLIWCNNEPVTINKIIKDSNDNANQCAIFDNATYTHDSPLASGSFSGNDCAIDYYVSEPKCLVYALDIEPHNNYQQVYNDDITPFPIITSKGNFSGGVASATARNVLYYQVIPFGIKQIIVNITYPKNLTLNVNPVNTTTNATFFFNGTLSNLNSDFFNCSFYVDNVLNQTKNNINLTYNYNFSYEWGYIKDTLVFNITCNNSEISRFRNFTFIIDSYDTALITIQKLTELNNNLESSLDESKKTGGAINMLWVLIFAIAFIIFGFVTRLYILWGISGLAFGMIAVYYMQNLTNNYDKLMMYGFFFIGSIAFLIGVGLQLIDAFGNKDDKFYVKY